MYIINKMDSITEYITDAFQSIKIANIPDTNIFTNEELKKSLFKSSDISHVNNTLDYLFKVYGKGIYIKIRDNNIEYFFPFKNQNYHSFWQYRIVDGFPRGYIHLDQPEIGLLDYFVIKDYNYDTDIEWIKQLFILLCKEREISDCEFFINSERNYPTTTVIGSIADSPINNDYLRDFDLPLIQHTVLSFNTSDKYKDLAIPNYVDFQRIIKNPFGIEDFKNMKWEDKTLQFLYRGDSISQDYSRINFIKKIRKYSDQNFINVGITNFPNFSLIKKTYPVDIEVYKQEKDDSLYPNKEFDIFSKSKFIFLLDGIGFPEELSMILFSGSCILRIESDNNWKCWFDDLLVENTHYISIKSDLSDLYKIIDWCLANDDKCKNIAKNAREFAVKFLSKNGIFDYLQVICNEKINKIKREKTTINEYQKKLQENFLINYFSENNNLETLEKDNNLNFSSFSYAIGYNDRLSWSSYKAISMFLSNHRNKISLFEDYLYSKKYNNIFKGINDAFIGINSINYLYREIPNFCYTIYSDYNKNGDFCVYREFLSDSKDLEEFLEFFPERRFEIFIQICMALQIAYERFGFNHGNLSPKNVLIKELKKPITIKYHLEKKTWALDTKYIAVIVNYSNGIILSNFSDEYNKKNRMFIGDDLEKKIYESKLHIPPGRDLKYLFKKVTKKFQQYLNEDKTPLELMPELVSKSDLKDNFIRFGNLSEISDKNIERPENPRLTYDRLISVKNPEENVYNRIFTNEIPKEKTSIGNIILKYEISQNIKSVLSDFNISLKVDVMLSEKLKKCLNFINEIYDEYIKETAENFFIVDSNDDLYYLKMLIRRFLREIFLNKYATEFYEKFISRISQTIKDSLDLGIKNTLSFYIVREE